jgi:hypothetical protein
MVLPSGRAQLRLADAHKAAVLSLLWVDGQDMLVPVLRSYSSLLPL